MATVVIRVRIDRTLKRRSDAMLKDLGLDAHSFVSMALTQLVHCRGTPFPVAESEKSYFASEYGLTFAQAEKAGTSMTKEAASARRAGKLREINYVADLAL